MKLCLGEEDAYLDLAERTYARAAKQKASRYANLSLQDQRCNELDLNLVVRHSWREAPSKRAVPCGMLFVGAFRQGPLGLQILFRL